MDRDDDDITTPSQDDDDDDDDDEEDEHSRKLLIEVCVPFRPRLRRLYLTECGSIYIFITV